MKTERLYYFCDAFVATATVLKLTHSGNGGHVILDRTTFCVQRGRQPADTGTIGAASVTHVESPKDTPKIVIHTVADIDGFADGAEVDLQIDVPRRQLHSRLHSAGHLLAGLVEEILPGAKACGGHHWPGEARGEFIFEGVLPANLERSLAAAIANAIVEDLSVRRTMSH
jgi:Ser-tRNA(Ala) deacylase AlaX